ncbi:methyltransferase domain-containing protein [Candidatus Gottesmanbacteria bacterium]|nr:methyltransferase domain-containing protein [Candidatus Gottesmanbacteria bacterium]
MRSKAAKLLRLPKKSKILDVATGTGSLAIALAKKGYQVTGVDLSPDMLRQAKKKVEPNLNVKFFNLDATNLPYPSQSFDGASISFGLHDMPPEIGQKVLKEMRRVTKRGGSILVADHLEPSSHWFAQLFHPIIRKYETPNYVPFTHIGLTNILRKAGLHMSEKRCWFGLFQYTIAINQ